MSTAQTESEEREIREAEAWLQQQKAGECKERLMALRKVKEAELIQKKEMAEREALREARHSSAMQQRHKLNLEYKKALVAEYRKARQLQREEQQRQRARDEMERRKQLRAEIDSNRGKVERRDALRQEKLALRRAQEEAAAAEQRVREQKLDRLRDDVRSELRVLDDPTRYRQSTKSSAIDISYADSGPIFKVNGYSMNTLLADTRFKLSVALNEAGLFHSEAGRNAMATVHGSLIPRRYVDDPSSHVHV